eukprot:5775596-Amphidinium_carterae.1
MANYPRCCHLTHHGPVWRYHNERKIPRHDDPPIQQELYDVIHSMEIPQSKSSHTFWSHLISSACQRVTKAFQTTYAGKRLREQSQICV